MAQKKYKSRHDWVGKFIPLELCKRLKFDHVDKWYMLKPEAVFESETQKNLWDFEKQTDRPISVGRLDLIFMNKRKKKLVN